MQKILLYYKFAPIKDPETVRLWQTALCQRLNLKGRILISPHGLNGTVGGELAELKEYARQTGAYPPLAGIEFKWSDGGRDDFPRLSVKTRPEIVTFGAPDQIRVNACGVVGGGKRLKPDQLHRLIAKRGDEVVFFDGRNDYEAAIGRFKNAVVTGAKTTRDFLGELGSGHYDHLKNRPVVTYCTGGVRCEILSALMKQHGFKDVYQLDGGIVKYGEAFGDSGLWEGSLYVFDSRMSLKFSPGAKTIGRCRECRRPTSRYQNCALPSCNRLVLVCRRCSGSAYFCSALCRQPA
ncbi:MAG: rhodanese-related sulfurtransferase [Candidatus Chaera renei]|uniref:tRNA uridine(34) hydroxylase n=1 Tax=Candidatus Chaera renei TaxID=2506947 RepID=A0A4Q0AJK7_9BACT|nr:MAG: rhodanese-related sulfurtransferase [Candidatus Chaera renei]